MQNNNICNEKKNTTKSSRNTKRRRKKDRNYMHSTIELNSFQEPSFEVNSKNDIFKYVLSDT